MRVHPEPPAELVACFVGVTQTTWSRVLRADRSNPRNSRSPRNRDFPWRAVWILIGRMARPVSGTFRRVDRVHAVPGTTVRLLLDGCNRAQIAALHELGMSDLLLSGPNLRLGSRLTVAITLPGRFLEFEIPGMVTWHLDGCFGVSFDYLSARQTYGLVLAIDVISRAAESAPAQARGGQH